MRTKRAFVVVMVTVLLTACSSRTVTIQMSSAEGLTADTVVVMSGVSVGSVSEVKVRDGYVMVKAVITDAEAFPSGRELVFYLDNCVPSPSPCLRVYDAGPLAPTSDRPIDFYRGTSSAVELALWQGQGLLNDWLRAARETVR